MWRLLGERHESLAIVFSYPACDQGELGPCRALGDVVPERVPRPRIGLFDLRADHLGGYLAFVHMAVGVSLPASFTLWTAAINGGIFAALNVTPSARNRSLSLLPNSFESTPDVTQT